MKKRFSPPSSNGFLISEAFAKTLQNEIADTLKERPQKADVEFFVGKLLTNEQGESVRLTKPQAEKLVNKLLYERILNEDNKITDISKALIFDKVARFSASKLGLPIAPKIILNQEDYNREPFYGLNHISGYNKNMVKNKFFWLLIILQL
jgi:restriction endonuclease